MSRDSREASHTRRAIADAIRRLDAASGDPRLCELIALLLAIVLDRAAHELRADPESVAEALRRLAVADTPPAPLAAALDRLHRRRRGGDAPRVPGRTRSATAAPLPPLAEALVRTLSTLLGDSPPRAMTRDGRARSPSRRREARR